RSDVLANEVCEWSKKQKRLQAMHELVELERMYELTDDKWREITDGYSQSCGDSQTEKFFHTTEELALQSPDQETIEVVAWPGIAIGHLTQLVGKIKGGKTDLLLSMSRAVIDGDDFLDHATIKSPVVYLSEQSPST